MSRRPRVRFAVVVLLASCGGRPEPMTGTDAADSSANPCEGAVFEYRDVCFHAHVVAPIGDWYPAEYPFDVDGEPGDELVGVDREDGVSVHRFDGAGFMLVGQADAPPHVTSFSSAVVGEFDGSPGLDLIVSERGHDAALYHLDEAGTPKWVAVTALGGGNAFEGPVAVGPDASGRWRVVAHYQDGKNLDGPDPLALWEIQGTTLVQVERLDLPSELCTVSDCGSGDFDGDGRTDVVCTISVTCSNIPNEYQDQVVLLAQADGTVSAAAYPEKSVEHFVTTDLDGDGITDLLGEGWHQIWHRLGDGVGGLGPATRLEVPPTPSSPQWDLVAVGDLDGDADAEVVLGDYAHALMFDDIVGAPQAYEMLELSDSSLQFRSTWWATAAADVNADGIADLRLWDWTILVSERRQ